MTRLISWWFLDRKFQFGTYMSMAGADYGISSGFVLN